MSYLIFISVTLLAVLAKHNSLQPAQKRRYGRDWKEKNDGGNGGEREQTAHMANRIKDLVQAGKLDQRPNIHYNVIIMF